ncbi:MAG: hypothetical protein WBI20_14940 [Burkholderiaceae bacterium]
MTLFDKAPKSPRPSSLRYKASRETRVVASRTATAAECLGELNPGDHITGLTAGQFSAIDAMEHIVNQCGRADVDITTWTTGIYDIERTKQINESGRINKIRVLLDRANFEKSPSFAGPLIEKLGVDAFRCASIHAKFIIVRGDKMGAVFRSSMNLNKNLRVEHFDLDVCDAMVGFYSGWFESAWDDAGKSNNNSEIIKAIFDRYSLIEPNQTETISPFAIDDRGVREFGVWKAF